MYLKPTNAASKCCKVQVLCILPSERDRTGAAPPPRPAAPGSGTPAPRTPPSGSRPASSRASPGPGDHGSTLAQVQGGGLCPKHPKNLKKRTFQNP